MVLMMPLCLFSKGPSGRGDFLKYLIGTRPVAFGGAFTAIADDSSTFYYNPAGLTNMDWAYLTFSFQEEGFERYGGTVGFFDPAIEGDWGWSIAAHLMGSSVKKTYNRDRERTKDLSYYRGTTYLTIAKRFGRTGDLSLGINLKGIHQNFDYSKSYGGGLDLGLLGNLSFLKWGFMLQDAITVEKFTNRDIVIYNRILKIGLATQLSNSWKVSIQLDKNISYTSKVIFRIGGYIRLWSNEVFEESTEEDFEAELSENFKGEEKEFTEELHLNMGYGGSKIGIGLTLKALALKWDLTFEIKEAENDEISILFSMDIPLY